MLVDIIRKAACADVKEDEVILMDEKEYGLAYVYMLILQNAIYGNSLSRISINNWDFDDGVQDYILESLAEQGFIVDWEPTQMIIGWNE